MSAVGLALMLAVDRTSPTVGAILDQYGVKFADVHWVDEPVGRPRGILFVAPDDRNGNRVLGLFYFRGRFVPNPDGTRPEARVRAMRVRDLQIGTGPRT